MRWSILCDFDGTVSVEDVIDSLLSRYGRPGWQQLEDDWQAGRIGSRQCMRGQVALLDMDRATLDAHLDAVRIDTGFPAFVARAMAAGVPLRIVSDGLDYAIERILARHGLQGLPVSANQLRASAAGGWTLASPLQAEGCASGTCKCRFAAPGPARDGERVLLIGDGASDFCVANRVDFVFAKHRLIEHCRAAGIPYQPIAGFQDAIELLPKLLDGSLLADPLPLPAAVPA
ncbi:MtnX-like HAD-IB family phosphatase [Stenotrophomonas mori]|uniref:MtnX-like HAD-IB family phosphatase n=1 Tax=Stenotrophomonas mori TaxID=2871096 RepID=A0ABT0SFG7_9GAMM|nr:MtnX-like HAD-IB family phosphatase [Stenotrophomonas mori]MCL7714007.1 MtnX-like HAD-IB family phosphatase [Stenotrophomonas mori]